MWVPTWSALCHVTPTVAGPVHEPQCGPLHGVLYVMLPQLLQALPLNHSVGPYLECSMACGNCNPCGTPSSQCGVSLSRKRGRHAYATGDHRKLEISYTSALTTVVYSKLGCQIRLRTSVKTNNTRRRFWKITNPNHPVLKPDVNARTVALGEISYFEGRHVEKIVAN